MVKRSSDLIGKPVVASDSGRRLGFVADLLVDDADTRIIGLVLRHGWLNTEEVLPAASVQTLGADTIVSRSSELIGAKQWREQLDHPAVSQDQTNDGPFEG
jgi:uncharacterized protein YrrD